MFSLPTYGEMDPTSVMAPFYWLFFGLMIGDTGYGLVMLLGTALALKFLNFSESMEKMIRFFFWLSFAVIAAGFLYGSMFGHTFFAPLTGPDGAPKAILDNQIDIVDMLIWSVVLGYIQLMFGVLVKGWMLVRDGKYLDALYDSVFWVVCVTAAIGFLGGIAGIVPAGPANVCKWLFIITVIGLALTQGRASPSIGGKIASGLYGVYGLADYVGDLVSYTRIAALALSGGYIGFSFNLMIDLIPSGPVKWIAAPLIFLAGHALNLGLSALSAYVHTCRLMYVEYFGKFYEGGGVPFSPLSYKNQSVKVSKRA